MKNTLNQYFILSNNIMSLLKYVRKVESKLDDFNRLKVQQINHSLPKNAAQCVCGNSQSFSLQKSRQRILEIMLGYYSNSLLIWRRKGLDI